MIAHRLYWRSRLNAESLFYRKPVRHGFDYCGRERWPDWVSRKALWDDYNAWFSEQYAPTADRLPMSEPSDPGSVEQFFDALKPYLYDRHTPATASSLPVTVQEFHRGKWLPVVVRRRFIRVPPLEDAERLYSVQKQKIDGVRIKG